MSTQPENLSAYLDGELTAAEIAELEAELAADGELRAELEALESTVDFVRSHGPLQAPGGFKDGVLARVAEEPAPSGGSLVWLRRPMGIPLEALALAAAAVFVLVFALDGGPSETAADRTVLEPTEKTAAQWGEAEPTPDAEGEEDAVAQVDVPKKLEILRGAKPTGDADVAPAPSPRPRPKAKPAPAPMLTSKEVEAIGTKGTGEGGGGAASGYGAGSGMTIVPFSYTLSTEDPNVLKQLDVLARRYGGRLETSGGQPYSVAAMSPGTEKVFVRLPNTQMSNFGAELRKLGQVHLADANDMVASSEVTLEIRVDYEPGTTGYDASSYEQKK